MIRRQASCVVASGFSQNTGLPAAIAASTYSSWVGPQEHTIPHQRCRGDQFLTGGEHLRPEPRRRPARLLGVHVGDRDDRGSWDHLVSRRMWSWPIMPTPMMPTLIVMFILL